MFKLTVCLLWAARMSRHPQLLFLAGLLLARSAKRLGEPVCFWIAKQDEVNHHCKQEQENTLCHENATWVEDQPDFVKLCHFLCSPFTNQRTMAA
jgi:hypothetical protein